MERFITLPSNSNLDLFPGNTLNKFTVHFKRQLPIDETFEVALTEIHFPYETDETVLTDPEEDYFSLISRNRKQVYTVPIEKAAWSSKTELKEHVNHLVELTMKEQSWHNDVPYLKFTDNVLKVHREHEIELQPSHTLHRKLASKELDYIYVYSDIVEPSYVGDSVVKLLRIVDVSCKRGGVCSFIYETPQYHKVVVKEPQTIEIHLRTSQGDLIPLKSEGSTFIVLHARKLQQQQDAVF
jgi:hypothetical protein